MANRNKFDIAPNITIGNDGPLVVIAGPCVIESENLCMQIAETMKGICGRLGVPYIFKASFDKANRTSLNSFRGPGLKDGLRILTSVRENLNIPVLTDIHEVSQAKPAGQAVDILQIPAFLSRQTDLLLAAGETGKVVNVKKGQFMAPEDMRPVLDKVFAAGNHRVLLTERGTSFGYHNLVVDMRSLVIMRELGAPIVFDCTHAVQLPSGQGGVSGGQREFIEPLARAAAATGIDGLFMEVHPNPSEARSDGANSLPLDNVEKILGKVKLIHDTRRKS